MKVRSGKPKSFRKNSETNSITGEAAVGAPKKKLLSLTRRRRLRHLFPRPGIAIFFLSARENCSIPNALGLHGHGRGEPRREIISPPRKVSPGKSFVFRVRAVRDRERLIESSTRTIASVEVRKKGNRRRG